MNNFVADIVRSASDRRQGGSVPQFNDFGANVPQLPKEQGGIRGFSIMGGYFGLGTFTDGKFIRNTGELRDQSTWTHGRHTVSFGGNFERDQSNVRNTDLENGSWHSTEILTNNGLASFVMGHMHAYSQTSGNFSDSRQNVIGLFVEDKWKALPNLTITARPPLGAAVCDEGKFTAVLSSSGPTCITRACVRRSSPARRGPGLSPATRITALPCRLLGNADLNNLAPRVGVAWDVFGNGKTVLRSGGGAFYSTRLPGLFLNDASINQPFSLRTDLTEPSAPNSLIPFANPLQSVPAFAAQFPLRYTLGTVPPNVPFTGPIAVYGLEPGRRGSRPPLTTGI